MRRPYGVAVERLQRCCARRHVWKAADPDEAVRPIKIAKRADELDADGFLRFDELALEKLDQHVALARVQRVLAKLEHGGLHRLCVAHTGRLLGSMRHFRRGLLTVAVSSAAIFAAKRHGLDGAIG